MCSTINVDGITVPKTAKESVSVTITIQSQKNEILHMK